jgi:hypothetical protein
MSWRRALVVFTGDGPARADAISDRVQAGLERDRRQLFHHRHGASNRRFQSGVELNICANECIAQQCWADNRHVRLDEISGNIIGEAQKLRFILSAVPITDEQGNHVGALEIQRNVTDEAVVQVKYQEMLETEARERERLANQVRMRTKELLETNQLLLKTQKELLAYKKGLTV